MKFLSDWHLNSKSLFLGKVKNSGSISDIYTSLWKPWSYLTASSDAESAGTDSTGGTTPQTTTAKGFYILYNQIEEKGINKLMSKHEYSKIECLILKIHPCRVVRWQ